jgi:hypothetical protein
VNGFCDACGKPINFDRHGGTRKRFCSGACRAAFSRGKRAAEDGGRPKARITAEKRLRDLEIVYDALMAQISSAGVDGVPMGVLAEWRRVGVEIGRLAAPPANGDEAETDILKAVG